MADWGLVLAVIASVALAVAIAMLVVAAFPALRGMSSSVFSAADDETVFLFDGEVLVDATPSARALLSRSDLRGPPYPRLLAVLSPGFDGLEAALASLGVAGALTLTAQPAHGAALMLRAELRGGLTRIAVFETGEAAGLAGPDPMLHRAMAEELEQLRRIAGQAPLPIWRERADGEVVWSNDDYLARVLARLAPGEDLSWPLPRLFDRTASTQGAVGQRQRLAAPSGPDVSWFELTVVGDDQGRLVYAVPVDAAVQAELALRDFMQTLTQTFAHLPIGLAIFDRTRQLHMFNPALLDLTGLPVDFLAQRPTLLAILDALRESKMLPEPKDYRGWRRQMNEIEKAAAAGLYEEIWSLPGGQTYRVIARPHPNGALALMIEDVSTETLRTRRYRADLELSQAVTDAMEDAIAVFARDGRLVMTNPAYARLWGEDPETGLADRSIHGLCAGWRAATVPTPVWARAEDFVETTDSRPAWEDEVRLTDGRGVRCRFLPLPAGATMVVFRPLRFVAPIAADNREPSLMGGKTA